MGVSFGSRISAKEFIVWEVKKQKLYGNDSCPQSQSSPGGLWGVTGLRGTGMVSSGKVSCIVFIEYLLVHVMCVLVHEATCTCGCKCKCDNCMDR